ncbi:hypothetical protein PROH_16790 [Prochlorothrix hollandica PCC 9006 = CALU 1027]|uniref:Putative restriction endonuclease domain-containing protein n=2 Tax=Prochlorothrix hollandica TaxID=1223 RepID=A0A0M2PRC7_PROHO|nr:hypothetical protein PROH_16790 [Prochlorothrix hollandica PCC 9006 = CALU 1027]
MVSSIPTLDLDRLYPSGDGNPMAENTEQYRWIVLIAENLKALFAQRDDVFIGADLLWYALQHHQKVAGEPIAQAPDVMVVFQRPPGPRLSYKQWQEDGIPPQVVFEILSPSNKTTDGQGEMRRKFEFYQRHGVEEYYCYDPLAFELTGWIRQAQGLVPLTAFQPWDSPRLGVRFVWQPGQDLRLYRPTGQPFLEFARLDDQWQAAESRADRAELQARQEQLRADQAQAQAREEQLRADQAQAQAHQEQLRANQAQAQAQQVQQEAQRVQQQSQRVQQEAQRVQQENERLAAYLRSLGLDPDGLPDP